MKFFTKNFSLKKRIFVTFFCILLSMVCTYIFVISRFITRFMQERLNADYESILSEASDTVGNILWNLTLTSQQLLDNETILLNLEDYFHSSDLYIRQDYYRELLDTVYSLTMANTELGLLYFYDVHNREYIYSTLPVDRTSDTLPVLYENAGFRFQGPCKSQSNFIGNPVLVLTRTENLANGKPVTLSLESGYYSLDKPLQAAKQKSAYLAFTSNEGNLVFSTYPDNGGIMTLLTQLQDGTQKEYRYLYRQTAQGWTAHIIIPNSVYTHDFQLAIRDFVLCTLLAAFLVGGFALFFWKSVYRPLQLFDRQLSLLLSDKEAVTQLHSSIPEYEYLFHRITLLQKQIQEMIHWKVAQEKLHSQMQLEKLRAQINPHFLMNTLNTLHWMALMNQQPDIDSITQSLSHLLSYNLDKQSYETDLKNEILALKEYVTLQQVRYSFAFNIHSDTELENLNYPCPKFILQPLVENSLSHGYREGMAICLHISVGDNIKIKVCDTGSGMVSATLEKLRLLSSFKKSPQKENAAPDRMFHAGIGLPYVVQILDDFYKGNCKFEIDSTPGEGTVITLNIPKLKGEGYHAENTDC